MIDVQTFPLKLRVRLRAKETQRSTTHTSAYERKHKEGGDLGGACVSGKRFAAVNLVFVRIYNSVSDSSDFENSRGGSDEPLTRATEKKKNKQINCNNQTKQRCAIKHPLSERFQRKEKGKLDSKKHNPIEK
jgi:hypothetical protein